MAEGMLGEEIILKFPDLEIPEMESETSVFTRAIKGLKYYDRIYSDVNILVVTHGAILKILMDNQIANSVKGTSLVKSVPGGLFKIELLNGGHEIKEIKV